MSNSMYEAAGIIEVYGFAAAVAAGDAACKAANVRIESFDRNKPAGGDKLAVPLLIAVKIRGSIADVHAGIEAAEAAANEVSGVAVSHVIARPDVEADKMLKLSMFAEGSKKREPINDDLAVSEDTVTDVNEDINDDINEDIDEEDNDDSGSIGND